MTQAAITDKFLKEYIRSINTSRKRYFELLVNELNILNKNSGMQFDKSENHIVKANLSNTKMRYNQYNFIKS